MQLVYVQYIWMSWCTRWCVLLEIGSAESHSATAEMLPNRNWWTAETKQTGRIGIPCSLQEVDSDARLVTELLSTRTTTPGLPVLCAQVPPPRLASSSKNHLSRLQAISGQISYIIWTTLISHIYLFLVLSGDKFQMLHPCSTLFGLDFAFPLDLINSSAFNVLLSTDIDW